MKNLSIIITSCEAYSDMWINNISSFKKHWLDDSKIVLTTDSSGDFDTSKVPELKVYKGEMSKRIIDALKDIDTKYVFITFDDYYLIKDANLEIIKETIDYMDKHNVSYCGSAFNIKKGKKFKAGNLKLFKFDLNEPYEINFYPSIWNREDLIASLKEEENIWISEAMLTKRLKMHNQTALMLLNKDVFTFLDVCRKGKYLRKAYKYLKKHNLYISDRGVRTIREEVSLAIRLFTSIHAPKWIKKKMQNRYRKAGHIIYSDYFYDEDYY